MTTFDARPTTSETVKLRLADMLTASARKSNRTRAMGIPSLTAVQMLFRILLHLGGFALLTIGAFTFSMTLGYIIAGVSLFAIDKLLNKRSTTQG